MPDHIKKAISDDVDQLGSWNEGVEKISAHYSATLCEMCSVRTIDNLIYNEENDSYKMIMNMHSFDNYLAGQKLMMNQLVQV